jgi:hypothetical protein
VNPGVAESGSQRKPKSLRPTTVTEAVRDSSFSLQGLRIDHFLSLLSLLTYAL